VIFQIFLGVLSMQRREVASIGGVHMCDTNCDSRYLVLVRLLVTKYFCNAFVVQVILTCWCMY
jgi:hypothetical protein